MKDKEFEIGDYCVRNSFVFIKTSDDDYKKALKTFNQIDKLPYVPNVDKSWTDEMVYKYFDLTQEEINTVEAWK